MNRGAQTTCKVWVRVGTHSAAIQNRFASGISITSSGTGWQAHVLQARTSMNQSKATGSDRVVPEMIKALPCQALRFIRQTFERRYMGLDTQLVESWQTIIILLTKHVKHMTQLQGHIVACAYRAQRPSGILDACPTFFKTVFPTAASGTGV